MTDKQDRRHCFADIDIHSTEKFGLLCSPFQALQLVVSYHKERERAIGIIKAIIVRSHNNVACVL